MGALTSAADAVLDRSLVLGYTKLGPALRRRWWPADPEPDCLAGQRVVVTGATSGIGEAMVTLFAALGATVHVLGRNPDKVATVVADVRRALPADGHGELVEEVCDVSDLDAVRTWCDDLARRVDSLRGLVHNAGAMLAERTESAQGHEMSLAVHVLGPQLMTERLLPLLGARADAPGSVVWMSSGGMYSAGLRSTPDEIEYREAGGKGYDGVRAYARTKRMQVEIVDAWNDRLRGGQVRIESCHPGWAATPGVTDSLPGFDKVMGPLLRDAASGADTAVWLVATRPDSSGTHHFWHDRAPRPTTYPVQRRPDPAARRAFVDYVAAATGTVWP